MYHFLCVDQRDTTAIYPSFAIATNIIYVTYSIKAGSFILVCRGIARPGAIVGPLHDHYFAATWLKAILHAICQIKLFTLFFSNKSAL